jgi:hypothetical protein
MYDFFRLVKRSATTISKYNAIYKYILDDLLYVCAIKNVHAYAIIGIQHTSKADELTAYGKTVEQFPRFSPPPVFKY